MNIRSLIPAFRMLAFGALLGCASGAQATTLTLVDVLAGAEVQQTNNNPCVFGDDSCDPGLLLTYTKFPPGGGSQTYTESQSYTVATVRNAVGNAFDIGIDVNTTNAKSDTLDYFRIFINGVQQFNFETDTNLALAVDLKNGTGWSDWLLQSVNLAPFNASDTIRFDVQVLTAVDGREQFFLISKNPPPPPPPAVPEPASLLLLGSGLVGLAAKVRGWRKM